MKKLFILLVLIVGVAFLFINFTSKNSYTNTKYGFGFTDTSGWEQLPPQIGEGVTFKRKMPNGLDSYTYLLILPLDDNYKKYSDIYMTKDFTEQYSTLCKNNADEKGLIYKTIQRITINNANAYRCDSETYNSRNDLIIFNQYIVTTKKANIIITALYNAKETEEKNKTDQIINSLKVN
ncbi:MAG: hypothetical protein Q7R95_01980 [bacterium]|nr:hypothetical protein [bacterium]